MTKIKEIQEALIEELNFLGDGFDQYSYLIELSVQLPQMDESLKTKDRLVEGCQSKVWLDMHKDNGRFIFSCDSNTLIMRGVLELLRKMFYGQPLQEVAEAEVDIFDRTEILASFDSDRQKGIGYIVNAMKRFALS